MRKQTKPTLEKDFVDKRRSAVNLLVTPTRKRTLAELELSAEKLSAGVWSEGHEKAAVQLWRELCRKRARRVSESQTVDSQASLLTLGGACSLGKVALREGG